MKKVKAIVDLNTDIIILCDTRISNSTGAADLQRAFLSSSNNAYVMTYNSSKNSRGICILYKSSLDMVINHTHKDVNENILGLNVTICGQVLNIVGIYGPNNDNMSFYVDLHRFLTLFPDCPSIIGGDWNATFSTDNSPDNIDIFRMAAPPSIIRSRAVAGLCETFNLTDPYRALHPDQREFTFRPHTRRGNRSRLDFFLVSDNLLRYLSDCSINPALSTELFDHKAVKMSLNKPNFRTTASINLTTLNHPRLMDVISCTVAETYLQHVDRDRVAAGVNIEQGLLEIGEYHAKIREINDFDLTIACEDNIGRLALLNLEQQGKVRELLLMRETQPTPEELNVLPLSCDDSTFLEVLLGNLKGSIISLQAWQRKVSNTKKGNIIAEINQLRGDFLINSDRICQLEELLNGIVEAEISEKIKSMKLFEGLHSEKPNSLFLSLAKNKGNSDSLNKIRGNDNVEFNSDSDREEFIVSFYEDLYKKPGNGPPSYDNIVENFLGEEIVNSDLVQNSLLTDQERENMETPLQVTELDKAVEEGNPRSAPGVDGFGMPLIKKCWKFLRLPLLRYSEHCFETGNLTDNFRGACIKLIPKKADATKIKNWRPISLLSNLYKIISRALNNRLSKVIDRICSRAQKGFNKNRYTQEVLINVWESIAYCKENQVKGAILAIDMAKAFDTLSSEFLEEVYKFYGIGPSMRRWLHIIGNNRYACIRMCNDKLSRRFNLERGRPQGDVISPTTFNFCAQILIFKLELDTRIKKMRAQQFPVLNANPPSFFMCESNRETSKNESLADDNTTLTLLELESLRAAKSILDEFGNVSGLKCNFDKSVIMPIIAPTAAEVNMIQNLGFSVADELTLLGVKITRNLNNLREITLSIKEKIVRISAFWERFRLTLPGRLTILKTCLISQINYLGCFLPLDITVLGEIQVILDGFVKKNLRVSNDRLYLQPEQGGLGCIELKTFLQAQQCMWIKRAIVANIDNWRYDARTFAPGNRLEDLLPCDVNQVTNPIIHNMAIALSELRGSFTCLDGNYRLAKIFGNKSFTLGANAVESFDHAFFGLHFYENHREVIRNLTFGDFFIGARVKSRQELADIGLPLSAAVWFRLQAGLIHSLRKLRKNDETELISKNMTDLMEGIKKGSKKIKRVFDRARVLNHAPEGLRIVNTFARLTGTNIPDRNHVSLALGSWRTASLPNDCREFLFRQRNNQLMTNLRLNAFDNTISKNCTFCRIRNMVADETFEHLFFSCPTTRILLQHLVLAFEPIPDLDVDIFLNMYWYGIYEENPQYEKTILLIFDLFRYCLWKVKKKRSIPNKQRFLDEYKFVLLSCTFSNLKLRASIENCNLVANLLPAQG